jgi:hypothetical protein
MARVPTIAEEDAKRPNRERECLVGEHTRIVNRIKSTLARLQLLARLPFNTRNEAANQPESRSATPVRLVVSLRAPVEVDIYTPIETAVGIPVEVEV